MRYSSQVLFGLLAIFSIASVQTIDMAHGSLHSYSRAVNDIGTDDGLVFDTRATATIDIDAILQGRNGSNAV